jgi:hypothetical protein
MRQRAFGERSTNAFDQYQKGPGEGRSLFSLRLLGPYGRLPGAWSIFRQRTLSIPTARRGEAFARRYDLR